MKANERQKRDENIKIFSKKQSKRKNSKKREKERPKHQQMRESPHTHRYSLFL